MQPVTLMAKWILLAATSGISMSKNIRANIFSARVVDLWNELDLGLILVPGWMIVLFQWIVPQLFRGSCENWAIKHARIVVVLTLTTRLLNNSKPLVMLC